MPSQPPTARTIRLDRGDNVVVALEDVAAAARLEPFGIAAGAAIAAGHKIAVVTIERGEPIVKFGQPIGVAADRIAAGEHVHTHNVDAHDVGVRGPSAAAPRKPAGAIEARTFDGLRRADGRVATRNYVGIVTSVNCSATVARHIATAVTPDLAQWPNVDGVVAITHNHGCCQGVDDEGMKLLQRTLRGFCGHPNFAAVLVLGLGCETNQIGRLLDTEALTDMPNLRSLTIQDAGGTRAAVERGADAVREMLQSADAVRREPVPVSELKLGLECGGSDGYSGLTANPALGRAADLLVRHGGTAILSETPEIYGAEHLLLGRAANEDVASKLRDLLRWWETYVTTHGTKMDNNPSHGNKAGGLTTIFEKSLGAVAKSGSSPLVDVYRYAEPITKNGFVFMDSPGYDPMSITGQVASGANLVAFTTGRGSVYGCKPVPSIKIATNTAMYRRMRDDMDINCGLIVDGEASVDEMGQRIFDLLIETASGRKTRSEELGFGDDEFVPWVLGAQM